MLSRRDFLKLSAALIAAPLAARLKAGRTAPPADAFNILIVLFDTLSARHCSLYGYPRRTTPHLERFAEVSVVFHQHHAAGNFTTPGTASLLTGTYPWKHRALHFYDKTLPAFESRNLFSALEGWHRDAYTHNNLASLLLHQYRRHIERLTPVDALCLYDNRLAENLFPRDYSAAFYSEERLRGYRSPITASLLLSLLDKQHYKAKSRALQEAYAERFPLGLPDNYNDQIFLLEDAIDWIIARSAALPRPFLGYYHLWPPHEPYTPAAEFIGNFDGIPTGAPPKPLHFFAGDKPDENIEPESTRYDEYLAYADAEFGRLYEALAAAGRLDDTLIVFTSDHGQLFERGIHGHITPVLYEPLLHIPLLIHLPGQTTREDIHLPTSAADLLPTLTRLAGLPLPSWAEGLPLPLSQTEAASFPSSRPVFAVEAKENARIAPLTAATLAVIRENYKLIRYLGYPGFDEQVELYDLQADPEEIRDLSQRKPSLVQDLLQTLARHQQPPFLPERQ